MSKSRMKRLPFGFALAGIACTLAYGFAGSGQPARSDESSPGQDLVAHGKYLVAIMDCGGCHSPHDKEGKEIPGLELTGHPRGAPLPKWDPSLMDRNILAGLSPTMTAFAGPFGMSVADNLTPDPETGIGKMTAEDMIRGLKTGRHWKENRRVLPPMPVYKDLRDEHARAIYAYLMSLKPVNTRAMASPPASGPKKAKKQ